MKNATSGGGSSNNAAAVTGDMDDYNPFDKQGTQPAVMPTSSAGGDQAPPPAYSASGQQQISTADFQVGFDFLL